MKKKRALVLCTANSARSQMAEGLINHHLADRWKAFSAGTDPAAAVHPMAVQAMAEVGIDISAQKPKHVGRYYGVEFDAVVTVCDNAAQSCPLWLGRGLTIHLGLPDPAEATGNEEERLRAFRQVRDRLRRELLPRLAQAEAWPAGGGSDATHRI